jgi:DNA invertase Pin-like site-specific DNA recombinase
MNQAVAEGKTGPILKQTHLTVAIYARVSTDDKGQDPLNQLLQLREFCARRGWQIVAEYTDEVSAKNGERADFKRMWREAAKRKFSVLVFWSLDRFTREGTLATLNYLQRLRDLGVGFVSFTEEYISSVGVFSDAIIGLLAALAQQERVRMSERTRAGLERARRAGRRLGRPLSTTPSRTTRWRRRNAQERVN